LPLIVLALAAALVVLALISLAASLRALSSTPLVLALATLLLIVLALIAHGFLLGPGACRDRRPAPSSR